MYRFVFEGERKKPNTNKQTNKQKPKKAIISHQHEMVSGKYSLNILSFKYAFVCISGKTILNFQ